MPSNQKVEALVPLQEVDLSVHDLTAEIEALPVQLGDAHDKVAHAQANLDEIKEEIKHLKLEAAKRELTVKECDVRITKLQTQANQAKKNDEYQALLKEASSVKAEKARIEEGLLDILYLVDEKGKLFSLRQEDLKEAEGSLSKEESRISSETGALQSKLNEVTSKRSEIASGVERDVIDLYERILNVKEDGLAISNVSQYRVIEASGKILQWQCEGCSVEVTSQDVNLLLMGKEVLTCRTCSRILVVRVEEDN